MSTPKFEAQKEWVKPPALPNLNSWLATTFNRLNFMAEKTHG